MYGIGIPLLTCLACLFVVCSSWPRYLPYLPAREVPVNCREDGHYMVKTIGHGGFCGKVISVGEDKNDFGKDFVAFGQNWAEICNLDSDGDNRTNGEELGDPNCNWRPCPDPTESCDGPTTIAVSHPGIYENVTIGADGKEEYFVDREHPDYDLLCSNVLDCFTQQFIFAAFGGKK